MKKILLLTALLALPLAAQAQNSTNITLTIRVEEGGVRTNDLALALSDLHVLGIQIAWLSNTGGNTFRNQARNEVKDRLESLRTEGRAFQFKTNKIDNILLSIQANWDSASAADRKLLTDWLAKYPPPAP